MLVRDICPHCGEIDEVFSLPWLGKVALACGRCEHVWAPEPFNVDIYIRMLRYLKNEWEHGRKRG